MDGAVRGDCEQRIAPFRRHPAGGDTRIRDAATRAGRVPSSYAAVTAAWSGQPLAAPVAMRVVSHARREAGDEQLGRCRREVGAAALDRLVDRQLVPTHRIRKRSPPRCTTVRPSRHRGPGCPVLPSDAPSAQLGVTLWSDLRRSQGRRSPACGTGRRSLASLRPSGLAGFGGAAWPAVCLSVWTGASRACSRWTGQRAGEAARGAADGAQRRRRRRAGRAGDVDHPAADPRARGRRGRTSRGAGPPGRTRTGGGLARARRCRRRGAREGELGAGLLVLGSRGLGAFSGMLLGSVSDRVARRAACPVVVVRGDVLAPDRPVLLGVDGAPKALRPPSSPSPGRAAGAAVVALTAAPPPGGRVVGAASPVAGGGVGTALRQMQEEPLRSCVERHPAVPVEHRAVLGGGPGPDRGQRRLRAGRGRLPRPQRPARRPYRLGQRPRAAARALPGRGGPPLSAARRRAMATIDQVEVQARVGETLNRQAPSAWRWASSATVHWSSSRARRGQHRHGHAGHRGHGVPGRLDHQDLHRDRGDAAMGAGAGRPRRAGRRLPACLPADPGQRRLPAGAAAAPADPYRRGRQSGAPRRLAEAALRRDRARGTPGAALAQYYRPVCGSTPSPAPGFAYTDHGSPRSARSSRM